MPAHLVRKYVSGSRAAYRRRSGRKKVHGNVAVGDCLINPVEPRCFIGSPIVEAYCLEREQEWAGAVLAPSAAAAFGEPDDLTFVRYDVPLKDARSMEKGIAVNWLHYLGGQE